MGQIRHAWCLDSIIEMQDYGNNDSFEKFNEIASKDIALLKENMLSNDVVLYVFQSLPKTNTKTQTQLDLVRILMLKQTNKRIFQ